VPLAGWHAEAPPINPTLARSALMVFFCYRVKSLSTRGQNLP
jgi:hypothetical protein